MSKYLNGLIDENNFILTENGGVAHKTTKSDLLDMFAMGAAMRNRSDEDVLLMFRKAYEENPEYALKCLFYIRDIRGGQGERRFFRLCIKDLANNYPAAMRRNIQNIPEFGRWDDLYELVHTPVEQDMWNFMRKQLALDVQSKTPSLLAKWMKSENTSSYDSKKLGRATRIAMKMTARQYRKTLSILRERINVLERLMSASQWDKIEFDKIPSKAGIVYRNAFARHDVERMIVNNSIQSYENFIKDKSTKVNAKDLYPYEIVEKAINLTKYRGFWNEEDPNKKIDPLEREVINKYWDNYLSTLKDFKFNGIAVVDTSASMLGTPMDVAISLGICCAKKCDGPFKDHYISFSSRPQLIKVEGVDFVDEVRRIYKTNICENTNIKATFDLLLRTAVTNHCAQKDLPENIIIISDMEFDSAVSLRGLHEISVSMKTIPTVMEEIEKEWNQYGYQIPNLIFWNVDARQANIPMLGNRVSFVSGMSPSIYQTIISNKSGYDLMMEILDSDRYKDIH